MNRVKRLAGMLRGGYEVSLGEKSFSYRQLSSEVGISFHHEMPGRRERSRAEGGS